jgi:hypothetical protein
VLTSERLVYDMSSDLARRAVDENSERLNGLRIVAITRRDEKQ